MTEEDIQKAIKDHYSKLGKKSQAKFTAVERSKRATKAITERWKKYRARLLEDNK